MEGRVELAPFRTLSDMITDATFSSPAVGDASRWYNRVKQNLLYYQTNYFSVLLLCILFYSAVNTPRYLAGLLVLSVLIAALTQRSKYGYLPVGCVLLGMVLLGKTPAVMYTLASVACPIVLTLVHASLRNRNVKNKVNSAVESMRVVPTPMGYIIECMETESAYIKSLNSTDKSN